MIHMPSSVVANPIGGRFVDGATGVSTETDRDCVLLRRMAIPLHQNEEKKGFDFIKGFPPRLNWEHGSAARKGVSWSWTVSWKKEATTNACWIYSPKTPIIETSRSSI